MGHKKMSDINTRIQKEEEDIKKKLHFPVR